MPPAVRRRREDVVHRMQFVQFAAVVLLACAPQAGIAALAGSVDSLAGSVNVIRNGMPAQPLTVGAPVNEGDQIATGADSWVLLEMVDGGSLTLRGKTRIRIDAYVASESDKTASKSWLSLIEGALRSVTGAIGILNPPGYRLSTLTVTLGVRGTDHETAYYPPGSTEPDVEPGVYDKVNQGETFLRTPNGQVSLKAGQAGFSDHRGERAPRVLAAIPAFYKRHAEIDRPLANRMRLIQARRQRKIETFRQRMREHTGTAGSANQQGHAQKNNAELQRERSKLKQESTRAQVREEREKRLRERKSRRQEEQH